MFHAIPFQDGVLRLDVSRAVTIESGTGKLSLNASRRKVGNAGLSGADFKIIARALNVTPTMRNKDAYVAAREASLQRKCCETGCYSHALFP